EIESQLSQRPDVREVVVLAYESLNGEKSLVAYITSENNIALNVDVLRDDLKSVLPEFMIPAYFILLDAFPLTPNGKIDRKGLPAPDLSNNSAEYLAPETSTEKVLADIWCGLLKVEKVGINDNFFNLGGHSLLATQLISKISKKFDISLPLV
ncbi:peptide synthase, partial [Acinetobacter pittii]|uniref:phosphopantetheine-binding protein n=1 Tax=Acinetobacter pittii TaxID=48296 RepID=UPI001982016A